MLIETRMPSTMQTATCRCVNKTYGFACIVQCLQSCRHAHVMRHTEIKNVDTIGSLHIQIASAYFILHATNRHRRGLHHSTTRTWCDYAAQVFHGYQRFSSSPSRAAGTADDWCVFLFVQVLHVGLVPGSLCVMVLIGTAGCLPKIATEMGRPFSGV